VSFHDELWSGTALAQLAKLSAAAQDQVEATVRQICREPGGLGVVVGGDGVGSRLLYAARAGHVLVLYQIDEIGEMVHVLRLDDCG
jgi:hypothetical protein